MSEDNNIEKTEKPVETGTKTPAAPAKKKVKGSNRFAKWFREMRSELKKVVWPTPKQTVNNTIVALVAMGASAVVVWGLDQVGMQIFQAIMAIAGR
ncbi:MAG: preprotein translocase subunit SecE [Oscillospiraceae bacterium]|nr:preprotein translocase subunit SecE [Oscillospiraceae bacterium]